MNFFKNLWVKLTWRTYTIKKGKHYSGIHARIFLGKRLRFKAIFDESAIYTSVDPVNQHDINKLYGFSEGPGDHMKNSARFGWRWLNGKLEIFAYCHNNSIVNSEYITCLDLNKEYEFKITQYRYVCFFEVNKKTALMPRSQPANGSIEYYLYPYFGGDEKAPHDITIKIKNK